MGKNDGLESTLREHDSEPKSASACRRAASKVVEEWGMDGQATAGRYEERARDYERLAAKAVEEWGIDGEQTAARYLRGEGNEREYVPDWVLYGWR